MVTRLVIEQDVARFFAQGDEKLVTLPVPVPATTVGPDTTTIIATSLGRGSRDANSYDGRLLKVISGTPGATLGLVAGVTEGSFASSDRVTISPAFNDALAADQSFILYALGLEPDALVQACNQALRKTEAPHIWLPSLITNADFEDDDGAATPVADNWNDVGTPTSRFLITTAADVLLGRSMEVITDAIDEGAESDSFPVFPTEVLLVSCFVKVPATGTLTVSLRDQTNTADIETKAVTIQGDFVEVRFEATVPTGCVAARLRFTYSAAATFHIASHVTVQSMAGRAYQSPRGLNREEQILGSFYIPAGFNLTTDQFAALSAEVKREVELSVLRSERDPQILHVELRATSNGPIGIMYQRAFAEMTSTDGAADTSPADQDWLVARTIANLLRDRGDPTYRAWSSKAAARAETLGYGSRELRIEPNPLVTV